MVQETITLPNVSDQAKRPDFAVFQARLGFRKELRSPDACGSHPVGPKPEGESSPQLATESTYDRQHISEVAWLRMWVFRRRHSDTQSVCDPIERQVSVHEQGHP